LFYIFLTLIIFAIYISLLISINPDLFGKTLCHIFYSIHVILYTITFLKNPGIPSIENSLKENSELNDYNLCRECLLHHEKNVAAFHCFDCGVCIEDYDHHCPWIGKCIGRGNKSYFNAFIVFTIVMILVFIFVCQF